MLAKNELFVKIEIKDKNLLKKIKNSFTNRIFWYKFYLWKKFELFFKLRLLAAHDKILSKPPPREHWVFVPLYP